MDFFFDPYRWTAHPLFRCFICNEATDDHYDDFPIESEELATDPETSWRRAVVSRMATSLSLLSCYT